MLEAPYKNNGFVNLRFIQYLKKSITNMRNFNHLGLLDRSEVGGENGSEAGVPRPGIQAQRPAPAPHASHARHDRSMARDDFGGWAEPRRSGSLTESFTKIRPESPASPWCLLVDFSKEK